MEIHQETHQGVEILSVNGRLDSNTSETFETAIYKSLDTGKTCMIINLEGLEYISSAGLRVILKTTKDLKLKKGTLILCSLQDYVREVFEIAGFDGYLNIQPSLEKALSAFQN